MSISEFYKELTATNDKSSFLASLRRLSLVRDASHFSSSGTSDPAGDWIVWNQPAAQCPSGAGA